MNLFKHTGGAGGYYSQESLSNPANYGPSPEQAPQKTGETKTPSAVSVNKPGFFSNEPVLENPKNWTPGYITEIGKNRFTGRMMNGAVENYKFFIPANEFDPEAGYATAKNNVYQVIFGSQVCTRNNVTVNEVNDIPESFKKWAQLKNQPQSQLNAPKRATGYTAPAPAYQQGKTSVKVAPDFTLEVGQTYMFSNNPESGFVQATLQTILPDRMIASNGQQYKFVIKPSRYQASSDWKRYIVAAGKPDGAPMPPQREEMTPPTPQPEGKAGIDRPLMEGDDIIVNDGRDMSDVGRWQNAKFAGIWAEAYQFHTNIGSFPVAIPKAIVEEVGIRTAIERFMLKITADGEIKPAVNP